MNLYDELFPDDACGDDEKVASRSMDHFGIRFDERVEKLAGVKDVLNAGKEWVKKTHGKGVKRVKDTADAGKEWVKKTHGKGVQHMKNVGTSRKFTPAEYSSSGYKGPVPLGMKYRIGEAAKGTKELSKIYGGPAALAAAGGTGAYMYNKKK